MTTVSTDQSPQTDPTVRELITSAASDVSTLLSAQVELAKAEIKESASQAVATFALIAAALAIAGIGLIFLLVTLAYVLVAIGLPVWAGFGIVTLLLMIIAAITALVGKKHATKIKGPERTMVQVEKTKAAIAGIKG